MVEFSQLGSIVIAAIFAVAALAVWMAGVRIVRCAHEISERTGLGHASIGFILLATITSLPEIAVTFTAAREGNTDLAINNLLGGIAMQVAVLAFADFLIGRRALTSVVPNPSVLLQGTLNILLLSVFAAGAVVGDRVFLGAGLWTWLLLGLFMGSVRLLVLAERRDEQPWRARRSSDTGEQDQAEQPRSSQEGSFSRLLLKTALLGLVILVAGYLLARSGEEIATRTGLGSSFVGAVLVAIATSLPEISSVFSAARLGLYTMAISDIFGTNLLTLALVWLADIVQPGDAALNTIGRFSLFACILGTIVTSLFLLGLIERRDRTVLRMGVDSLAVLVCYLGGVAILYTLR